MPTPTVSAQEQLLLELVNRARLDPLGEAARYGIALNDGLSGGAISSTPKAPLAFDPDLNESAAAHSSWMLDTDTFSHEGARDSSPGDRMAAAGYVFAGSWRWGENISWRGTTGVVDASASILDHHRGLFLSAGHRLNILGDFREIGIAQEIGKFTSGGTTYNASMLTENFASSGIQAFLTGVAYTDADGDRFYDIGEGRADVVFDWLGDAAGGVASAAAGGYALDLALGATGWRDVRMTAGGQTVEASLAMTGTSIKLDLVSGRTLAASTDMVLGTGAANGRLLGVTGWSLTGNGDANVLDGNAGGNRLAGGDGDDRINGAAGNDVLVGGGGRDRLNGGTGSDAFVFVSVADSAAGPDRDTIKGFAAGSDAIDVSAIDAQGGLQGNQTFALDRGGDLASGEVRQTVTAKGLVLEFNTDGDADPEMAILLSGVRAPLSLSDFVL